MNIPERIVSIGRRSEKTAEFNAMYKMMVDAYAHLPFHLSEEAIPLNPKEIDAARLQGYCERMMSGLNEEQKNVWRNLYSDAVMQIKVIAGFFESFPDAEFEANDNISLPRDKRITCINKQEAIDKAAETDVPEDCKAYFEKVKAMADALNEAIQWYSELRY